MSATHEVFKDGRGEPKAPQPATLPAASAPESIAVLAMGVLPAVIRGLFSPRRRAMKLLTALDTDRRTVRLLSNLRRKYDGEGLRLVNGKIVVLWGVDAIKDVLDHSAERYASDAGAKAKGMSHFQPDALTLSRGEEWRDRRRFNTSVLASDDRVHPYAGRFVSVVQDEVSKLPADGDLDWPRWEALFDHITLRVIFGDGARDNRKLTELLEQLMSESNRLVGLSPSDDYYEFYGLLERQLRDPEPQSLLARFADAPHNDRTRVVQQIPHWMFAMRDTLGANAFRALVAIVADPATDQHVRDELAEVDLSDPGAVARLSYLEGCLQEAMRLWPTTPLLARETTQAVTLAGEELDEGTQVMLLNVFNHRDPEHVADPDRLHPERWSDRGRDYRFNHLSNGTQDCPGGPLVLLLGKAVIANVVKHYDLTLEQPQLAAGEPLPYMLNFFDASLGASRRRVI
jgi:cytochrome P450